MTKKVTLREYPFGEQAFFKMRHALPSLKKGTYAHYAFMIGFVNFKLKYFIIWKKARNSSKIVVVTRTDFLHMAICYMNW